MNHDFTCLTVNLVSVAHLYKTMWKWEEISGYAANIEIKMSKREKKKTFKMTEMLNDC